MSKKIGIGLTDEAWGAVERLLNEASEDFEGGSLSASDVINEMILCSKVDVKALQMKHVNLRRTLKALSARKDLDIEMALKMLTEIKGRSNKKKGNGEEAV